MLGQSCSPKSPVRTFGRRYPDALTGDTVFTGEEGDEDRLST